MDKISDGVAIYQHAMNLRALKQQQIASNIANADTPKYLAKEFDFAATMKSTIENQNGANPSALQTTNSKHMTLSPNGMVAPDSLYRVPTQPKPDGNTVEVEHEKKEMIENTIQFQMLTQLTTDYFNKLRTAMQPER